VFETTGETTPAWRGCPSAAQGLETTNLHQ
jgi:hypothetical protein